jgi:CheY-like chemotaxis protein
VKTILLADDSITIQKVVELTFSEGEYQVICVSNGTEALKKVREVRPSVALLDIIMPEKNGYEVCEAIKRDPATAHIPVLLLTGTFEPFDEKRADSVGAVGHLTKPFESHALVSRVDELIAAGGKAGGSRGPARDPLEPPAVPAPAAPPAAAPIASAGVFEPHAAHPADPPAWAAAGPVEPPSHGQPMGTPPDPADGGSFQTTAPFDLGIVEEEILPERLDDPAPATGETVRLSREEVLGSGRGRGFEPVAPASADPMEGFVSGYEIPTPAPPPAPRRSVEVHNASAPAELSQEMIDRIAERVVQRMSDRAVREIAWEVIPQVAEAIVRNRIKELEEQGEG